MATRQSTIDHLLDQLRQAGKVTARRMFGEYCVYLDEKPVGLVCDDLFHLKPTVAGRQLLPDVEEAAPFPGAKPYLVIPTDDWEKREAMCDLLRATFDELPAPKPRKRRS